MQKALNKQDYFIHLEEYVRKYAIDHADDDSRKSVLTTLTSYIPQKPDGQGAAFQLSLYELDKIHKMTLREIALEKNRRMLENWRTSMTGPEDETTAQRLLDLFFEQYAFVDPIAARSSLVHWLRNVKRIAMGLPTVNETLLGFYSTRQGNGKSQLARQLCRALSLGRVNEAKTWDAFRTGSFNENVFAGKVGPVYMDEIHATKGLKDIIKSHITAPTIEINQKYKEPYEIRNVYPIILTSNHDPAPFVFEDEGVEQRRNATWEVIGRRYNHEDWQDGWEYLFANIIKRLDVADHDSDEVTVDTRIKSIDDIHLAILEDMLPWIRTQLAENGSFRRSDFRMAAMIHNGSHKDMFYGSGNILNVSRWFVEIRTKNKSRRLKPLIENIEADLKNEKSEVAIEEWSRPTKTVNLHKLVDAIIHPTPDDDKKSIKVGCATNAGKFATRGTVRDLAELLSGDPWSYSASKESARLVFSGYSTEEPEFDRREDAFDRMECIMIDCDNENSNPNIIDEFEKRVADYEYYIYETYSSTPERPKFRAILPLDESIDLKKNDIKMIKKAVAEIFSGYTDRNASWFFLPTRGRAVRHHDGARYQASVVEKSAEFEARAAEEARRRRSLELKIDNSSGKLDHEQVMKACSEWYDTYYNPREKHDGKSDGGFFHALQVALVNNDAFALELFKEKARREGWRENQIQHKMDDAEEWARTRTEE